MKTEFVEIQRFTQWWLWLIILGLVGLPLYGIYRQIIQDTPWGSAPMPDWGLFLFLAFMLLFALFFLTVYLRTEIDPKGIRVRLSPIDTKVFGWEEIERLELIEYRFVGYGMRLFTRYGTVYNISGNQGLAIHLKDGGRFLIGTQHPDRIATVLTRLEKIPETKK